MVDNTAKYLEALRDGDGAPLVHASAADLEALKSHPIILTGPNKIAVVDLIEGARDLIEEALRIVRSNP